MHQFVILLLLISFSGSAGNTYYTTCARMDAGPFLAKIAAGMCISSCKFQNCGTGTCRNVRGRKTCVCSRCRK
ncbi:hypothetical protein RB195_007689 [Necator americanus]|uniref:Uncharacterized protein n=1 Tax=Necator americanus TaxID=51031 RepID=A0ABR1C269_NECAM